MNRLIKKKIFSVFSLTIVIALFLFIKSTVVAENRLQQPTIAIPTVTGTPQGVMAYVDLDQPDPVNVRKGPGVFYEEVGVLLPGESVPALGKSAGGDWILIRYPGVEGGEGWVYSPLVTLSAGELPIIEPPPTPTPLMTATINPTFASQFAVTPVPTNLPTYTPAPPQLMPTYTDEVSAGISRHIPMGLIIIIIGGLGVLVAIISLITEH